MRSPYTNVECAGDYLMLERYELHVTTETRGNRQVIVTFCEWVPVFHFDSSCK